MRKKVTILMIVSVLMFVLTASAYAQSREEEEKKKQQMVGEQKALEEKQKALEEKVRVEIRTDDVARAVREARDAYSESWTVHDPVILSTGSGMDNIYFYGGSSVSSSLEYTRTVKETSFTKDYEFAVEEGSNRASIKVSGTCKEGEIRIKISMPSGKTYTEVLIDEYGSVNWSKTFSIDEENSSSVGDWKFEVTASNATGNFRLSLRSY